MNKRSALVAVSVVLLSVLGAGPAIAKIVANVVITGPGLEEPIEISEPERVQRFVDMKIGPWSVQRPNGLPDAFFEIRAGLESRGEVIAYSIYHYYPARNDSPGYFHHADIINGQSSGVGMWAPLTEADDQVMQEFLRNPEGR